MFKPTKAETIDEYFEMLVDERRQALEILDRLIKEAAPSLKPWFTYNMLGYGKFDYTNYKKEQIQWPTIALASQKNYISLYVCALAHTEGTTQYIAEKYAKELYKKGVKPNVGKTCIRFNQLDDLNLDVLKKVIKQAEKQPGLVMGMK